MDTKLTQSSLLLMLTVFIFTRKPWRSWSTEETLKISMFYFYLMFLDIIWQSLFYSANWLFFFLIWMKLQNTHNKNGLSSIIRSENDENSASGFDPFGSPFGPEGVPPEINFPNPVHAEQYRKIREKAKNSPPLPYLSATQLSRQPTNPRPSGASPGNSSPSQGPPAQSGGTSSNPPAGAAGNGTQAGQQVARAPSVTPNTTTAATPSTKTTTTIDASATASKNKTGIT